MSTKFEQLLDYLVNEEMDQANKLFHEIVVEKSKEIYENLIAQEAADEEEMDESADEEEMDESADEEEMDESADEEEMDEGYDEEEMESSYSLEGDDSEEDDEMSPMDKTDDLELDVTGDEEGDGNPEDEIRNAIEALQAALADMGASPEGDDEFDAGDDDMGSDEMPMIGLGKDKEAAFEGRRVTREYVEKVGKETGPHAGAGSGETMPAPVEGVSPISKGSGKPTSGAKAIHTDTKSSNEDGTKPHGKAGGFLSNAKEDNAGNQNVPGAKMGVKALKKVAKTGNNEGHAVGAGTGENSVKGATNTHSPLAK